MELPCASTFATTTRMNRPRSQRLEAAPCGRSSAAGIASESGLTAPKGISPKLQSSSTSAMWRICGLLSCAQPRRSPMRARRPSCAPLRPRPDPAQLRTQCSDRASMPSLARIGPTSTRLGRILPNFDKTRPKVDQIRPFWAFGQSLAAFVQGLVGLGQIRAKFGQVRSHK